MARRLTGCSSPTVPPDRTSPGSKGRASALFLARRSCRAASAGEGRWDTGAWRCVASKGNSRHLTGQVMFAVTSAFAARFSAGMKVAGVPVKPIVPLIATPTGAGPRSPRKRLRRACIGPHPDRDTRRGYGGHCRCHLAPPGYQDQHRIRRCDLSAVMRWRHREIIQ